ncbi:MAG: PAS domain S-box protein, partial [Candidatus Krumholzibacteriia bacterium]
MERFRLLLLVISSCCWLGGAGPASAGEDRVVRFGVVPIEPVVLVEAGRPGGLAIDLLEAVAARRGWRLEYVVGTWDDCLARQSRGELDLLAPTGWSAARDSVLDYGTRPLMTFYSQVFVRGGMPVRTILDLADRTVAVLKGDINGEHFRHYVARFNIDCRIVEEPSFEAVFARVAGGGAAAAVAPNVVGYTRAGAHGLVASPIIFEPFGGYFTVPAGTNADLLAALDEALAAWQDTEDSFYHERLAYWWGGGGGGGGAASAVPRWLVAGAAAVLLAALVLLSWNRLLKREVRRHTRELRRSQERFRAIFDNHFQLSGLLDPDGVLMEANAAALALSGLAPADVIGRPYWECGWWTHDPQQQARVRAGVRTAAAGGFVRFEASHPAPDGSLRLVDFSLKPVHDDDGRLLYLLPEGRDITDERHGGIRYRNLFESAGDAIFIIEQGRFIECNARTLELFRCDRDQIIGRDPGDLSPPRQANGRESRQAAEGYFAAARRDRVVNFAWKHRRPDGSLFDAEVTLTAHASAGLSYVQAIVRDVTARKQLEADLRHAQKMEAIGTLAGGIAHDFNNILAAILGFGELARLQAESDPALCDTIDQIMRAGGRARDLVRQILAFGRRTAEQRRPVDLGPIVAETLRLLRSSIPATIALRRDLRAAGPVLADATSLHQVAMNLCTNASQALAPTGGELAVTVREVDLAPGQAGPGAGPWVVLEVRDDGPGISAEIQAKIFEPYFTTKGVERGTGLGLSVVHGIVREHRGTIEVESAPGQGALFRVWLPRHVNRATAADEPDAAGSIAGTERVLLVDDEPDIVRIGELGLARHGYRVQGFTAPQAALAAF